MANIVDTYVSFYDVNDTLVDWIKSMTEEGEHGQKTLQTYDVLNHVYGTEFSDDTPPNVDWMIEEVGSKSVHFEYLHFDKEGGQINIESKWSVPFEFLIKLVEMMQTICEDVYISGTYEDESFDPIGAFCYGYGLGQAVDLEEEIDPELMVEDVSYFDNIQQKLQDLSDELVNELDEYRERLKKESKIDS